MRTLLTLFLCAPLCAGGLPYDKKCHVAAGAVAYVAGYEIARACDSKHPRLWGLASSLAVGLVRIAPSAAMSFQPSTGETS